MTATALKKDAPQFKEPAVTADLAKQFGLSGDEYKLVLDIIGRTPTYTELGIFSVMWSEHCSYKSSRIHLKKLPTSARVIQGPGENAGVIDIGDGQAAVFRWNPTTTHPISSLIRARRQAWAASCATSLRWARVRLRTSMRCVSANRPTLKPARSCRASSRGFPGYGNCVGVPTVGGETNFHASYNGNNLVNAMTVGLADQDKIYYARGAGVNQPIVYVGSRLAATVSMARPCRPRNSKTASKPSARPGARFYRRIVHGS